MAKTVPNKGLESDHLSDYNRKRSDEILQVIMSYARMDFSPTLRVNSEGDVFDAISAGINMLGEELEISVVTIQEKEALLKEVHHRVKNNLQIVSSLLNLQSSYSTDPEFTALINECKNRIMTMALIHEMLYQSKDLSRINARLYFSRLCENIHSVFRPTSSAIVFDFQIDEYLTFDSEKMIPLGLIVNEVVSNSTKYAFPGNSGTITISVNSLDEDHQHFEIVLGDNGIGLPKNFVIEDAESLGMQLIITLTQQLDADLIIDRENGTYYRLKF